MTIKMDGDKGALQILKLQWPIIGNTILVYNQDRSFTAELPTTYFDAPHAGEIKKWLEKDLKIYVKGRHLATGQLEITEILGGAEYEYICGW